MCSSCTKICYSSTRRRLKTAKHLQEKFAASHVKRLSRQIDFAISVSIATNSHFPVLQAKFRQLPIDGSTQYASRAGAGKFLHASRC